MQKMPSTNLSPKPESQGHSPLGAPRRAGALRAIKTFIWAYFWLLIFEGVLRKWVVPQLAAPLLFIRDPILLVIYALSAASGIFPRNKFIVIGSIIGFLSFIAGWLVMPGTPAVAIYGFRSNFLHIPLIFIIGAVFNPDDVKKVGYMTLVLAFPLSLLMTAQFQAPFSSWLNVGAGEGAAGITSAGGHVRASASFSSIQGPIYFYALVAVFLINSQLSKMKYPRWLEGMAAFGLALATATSGSRTLVLTLAIIWLAIILVTFTLRPSLLPKITNICLALMAVTLVLSQLSVFNEAIDIFGERVENASTSEGGAQGILQSRILQDFTRPFEIIYEVPTFGYGLGSGTIVGSVLLGGNKGFTYGRDSERELTRHVLESGPILGLLFVAFRFWLFFTFFYRSLFHASKGNLLPVLLFSVVGVLILNGQLAQTTLQGFTALLGGFFLASANVKYVRAPVKRMSALQHQYS